MSGQPKDAVNLEIIELVDNDIHEPATIMDGHKDYTVKCKLELKGFVGGLLEGPGSNECVTSVHLEGQGFGPVEVDVPAPAFTLNAGGSPYIVEVKVPKDTLSASGNYRLTAFADFNFAGGSKILGVIGQADFPELLGVQY